MFKTYDLKRWPNFMNYQAAGGLGSTEGLGRFSADEIERRHALVQIKLKETGCDLLMVQCHYFPSVMAVSTKAAWLTGSNGYRNCVTLILPKEGNLAAVHGGKPSSIPGWQSPYLCGDDMMPYLKGAKRIAYADTGYMSWQFYQYLKKQIPEVEIIDFTNEIEHMMAVKSQEEIDAVTDACEIQKRCWQAAPAFIRPYRLVTEIRADIQHLMLCLGMDPTLMPKILLFVRPNHRPSPEDNIQEKERDYRLTPWDYITLCFETPGSGGYYAERSRNFFFDEPHPAIKKHWEEVIELHQFQMSLYRTGITMGELRNKIGQYKEERGYKAQKDLKCCTPVDGNELRGIGLLTVDRPQIQLDWEDLPLKEGMTFCTMPSVVKNGIQMKLYEMAVMGKNEAQTLSPYPLELFVL